MSPLLWVEARPRHHLLVSRWCSLFCGACNLQKKQTHIHHLLTILIMKRKRQQSATSSSSSMTNNNNIRTVQFSASNTRTMHYEDQIDRRSLIWYNARDLAQFRADRKTDATRLKNKENNSENEICFWGLERILMPEVRRKTHHTRQAVRKAVLTTQDGACVETIRQSSRLHSEYSSKVAQSKGRYYSNHLWW